MSNEINHFHVSTKHKGNILYEDIPDKYQAITSDNADYFEQENEDDNANYDYTGGDSALSPDDIEGNEDA